MTPEEALDAIDDELVALLGEDAPENHKRRRDLRSVRDHVCTGASAREALDQLAPLCPCTAGNPADWDGPQQDCPIHGDGATFVAMVRWWRAVEGAAMGWAAEGPDRLDDGENVLFDLLRDGPEAFR